MRLGEIYLVKQEDSLFAPHICCNIFYNASQELVSVLKPVKVLGAGEQTYEAKKGKKKEQLLILNNRSDRQLIYLSKI